MQWQNNINDICANKTKFCNYLKEFLSIQLDWMYTQIESYPDDEYWHQVRANNDVFFFNYGFV